MAHVFCSDRLGPFSQSDKIVVSREIEKSSVNICLFLTFLIFYYLFPLLYYAWSTHIMPWHRYLWYAVKQTEVAIQLKHTYKKCLLIPKNSCAMPMGHKGQARVSNRQWKRKKEIQIHMAYVSKNFLGHLMKDKEFWRKRILEKMFM